MASSSHGTIGIGHFQDYDEQSSSGKGMGNRITRTGGKISKVPGERVRRFSKGGCCRKRHRTHCITAKVVEVRLERTPRKTNNHIMSIVCIVLNGRVGIVRY